MTMRQVVDDLLSTRPEVAYRLLCSVLLARRPGGAAHISDTELAMASLHLDDVRWDDGVLSLREK